jgi:sodium-dependent dicarboxylate transporter 2/3/5
MALILLTVVIGTFMSNTAAANLFLPIGLSSASLALPHGGLHPIQIGMSIALAASMSMALPISTPPNAMAYGRGEFTTGDLLKVTLLVSGVGVLAIVVCGEFVMRLWKIIP